MAAAKKKETVLFHEYLTNTRTGHSKFYEITVTKVPEGYETITKHGKLGTQGRTIPKGVRTAKYSALSEAEKLVNSKIGRGYDKSNSSTTYGGKKTKITTTEKQALDRFSDLEW